MEEFSQSTNSELPSGRGCEGKERKAGLTHLNVILGQEENGLGAGEKAQF